MTQSTDQIAAWNQAAYEAAMSYARASLASAEQLLALNLETARITLDQAAKATRDLMSSSDPQQLMALRTQLAQANMQQAATYAQSVYEIVSQTQAHLGKLFEQQMSRLTLEMAGSAETLGKGAAGSDASSAALKSTFAATSAVLETLNQATRQFAEFSEATMKAATEQMVKGAGRS
ncbi:MAG TPA: phasin family protein [Burkholderiales bacterium]|jgi:phasin family protein|nr:phasin family protein [Burkholderiales bacterium]